jgi:hypothetical protein
MDIPNIFEQVKKPGDPGYLVYLSRVLIRFWGYLAKVVNNGIEVYAYKDHAGAAGPPVSANIKGYIWSGSLAAGTNTINHTLRYTPLGFIVIRITANTVLWFGGSTTTQITIDSSAAVPGAVLLIL